MQNKEIIECINKLVLMEQRENDAIKANPGYKRMNIKVVYRIIKNKQELKKAIEPYNESLKVVLDKFGAKMVDTGIDINSVEEEKRQAFVNELNKLLGIDVNVDIAKVNLDDFVDYDISQSDMDALEFMIE